MQRTSPPRSDQPQPPNRPQQGQPPPPWPPRWVPNRRQFYVPAPGDRGPGMWGKEQPYPDTPPAWQAPGIMQGVGSQLGMFGSPAIALLAIGLNKVVKAFLTGYTKGQGNYSREQERQLRLQAEQLQLAQGQELDEYEKIFREFGDPADWKSIPADRQQALLAAIEAYARQKNDLHMLNAMHNRSDPIQGVVDQLNWRDGKHSDLRAANKAREKEEELRKAVNPWLENPSDTPLDDKPEPDEGGDKSVSPFLEPAVPPAEEAPSTPPSADPAKAPGGEDPGVGVDIPGPEGRAEPQQPGAQLAERGDVMSDAPQPGMRTAQADAAPDSDEYKPLPSRALDAAYNSPYGHLNRGMIDSWARRIAAGEKVPVTELPKAVWPYVSARAGELTGELNRIQSWGDTHPSFRGQKVLDAVKKIDPTFGSSLEMYVSGAAAVPGGARNPQLPRILGLGHLVDPRWSTATYDIRKTTIKSFTSGAQGRNVISQLTALDHINYIKELATKVPHVDGLGAAVNRMIQSGITEGPEALGWARDWVTGQPGLTEQQRTDLIVYMNELRLVAPEIARAQKGAAPTLEEEHNVIKGLTGYAAPDLIRSLDGTAHLIQQRLKNTEKVFGEGMGGVRPGEFSGLFHKFENRGLQFDAPPAGTDQPDPVSLRSGRSYSDEYKYQLGRPDIPDPAAAPAAPASAAPKSDERPANVPKDASGWKVRGGKTYYQKGDDWYEAD